jgi:hypothetical protein
MVVTGTSVVLPEEDHLCEGLYLWNRKLCVVVPEEDLLCDSHQQLVYIVLESRACLYELGAV